MVEGHSVHRVASRFRTNLVGKSFAASSPNGRFADGSRSIDGRVLSRMEAVGKNLFAFFSKQSASDVVVHVHFGMSGAWSVFDCANEAEVKPTTRLRLEEITPSNKINGRLVAHLSAMTVSHGDISLYESKKAALGQDPLRPDADPDALYRKVTKSKKSIGQLIMDQSFFSGPGNIYRAEILFLAAVYPTTLGVEMNRDSFDKIWDASVKLLRRGYDTGSILTVDAATDPDLAARGERRYIYNRSHCARCGGRVRSWDMSGRTCYACEGGCQPKIRVESADVVTAPVKTVKEGGTTVTPEDEEQQQQHHIPFISHCAPDSYRERLAQHGPEGLTIAEIRSVLGHMLGSSALPPKSARKAVLVEALKAVLAPQNGIKQEDLTTLPPPTMSAEEAAREKAAAGENRAVEHVAELSREQAIEAIAVTPSPGVLEAHTKKKRAVDKKKPSRKSRRRLNYD